jgi:tRNA pseudouridine38-40 synthase
LAELKNVRLVIEYNGSAYAGWQYQPNQKTVQGELETALNKLTTEKITVHAAGRTDTGVHALGQVVSFRTDRRLPVEKYRNGLNFYLPDDILVRRAEEVSLDFDARYSAVYRHYRYLIGTERSALNRFFRWDIDFDPNPEALESAADYIRGEHDFSAFCVLSSRKADNRCMVYRSQWRRKGNVLKYEITADRFLHTMIRSLVGLMMELGRGDITMKQFTRIFNSGDHTAIRKVAPARGLYLVAVGY